MLIFALLLNFVFITGGLCGIFNEPAPVKLIIKSYGLCRKYNVADDGLEVYYSDRKVTEDKISYTGNVTFTMPHEDMEVLAKIDIMKDGQWVELFNYKDKDPVKLLNTYGGEMWYKVEDAVDGLTRGQHPIKPGFYRIDDYVVDWDEINQLPKPVRRFLLEGKYRGRIYGYYRGKEFACGHGEAELKKK